jgi:hypothetical protein
VDFALLVERPAAGELVEDAGREALGRASRLDQSLLPGALQLHDLGAMHETQAVVRDHLRLTLAPATQASVHSRA